MMNFPFLLFSFHDNFTTIYISSLYLHTDLILSSFCPYQIFSFSLQVHFTGSLLLALLYDPFSLIIIIHGSIGLKLPIVTQ